MTTQGYHSQPPPPRSHRATEVGFGEYKQWKIPKTRDHTGQPGMTQGNKDESKQPGGTTR
jgi:hypothetical protein